MTRLQEYPICWECLLSVEYDPVFEAMCGHEECPSMVFHGVCLMQWREKRVEIIRRVEEFIRQHPHGPGSEN